MSQILLSLLYCLYIMKSNKLITIIGMKNFISAIKKKKEIAIVTKIGHFGKRGKALKPSLLELGTTSGSIDIS